MKTLHEDAFYDYFQPYRHPDACNDSWGGIGIETFGKDLDILKSVDKNYLWTVMDGERGRQWIVAGLHHVDRVCYLVTRKPHNFSEIQFYVSNRLLTDIGLKRQLNYLKRLFVRE